MVLTISADNGLEFYNQNFNKMVKDHGILHERSCSYTPQQNGIIERKHRHLIEVAQGLPIQARIPIHFGENVLRVPLT